mmetsp:Transcript_26442/g.57442  ORF Transcript_26442/g.57442 Transcript_26442/m.57442 type:complete len:226 (-) Transcript_26442:930-1607(-)
MRRSQGGVRGGGGHHECGREDLHHVPGGALPPPARGDPRGPRPSGAAGGAAAGGAAVRAPDARPGHHSVRAVGAGGGVLPQGPQELLLQPARGAPHRPGALCGGEAELSGVPAAAGRQAADAHHLPGGVQRGGPGHAAAAGGEGRDAAARGGAARRPLGRVRHQARREPGGAGAHHGRQLGHRPLCAARQALHCAGAARGGRLRCHPRPRQRLLPRQVQLPDPSP